jgi:hypothetical protein
MSGHLRSAVSNGCPVRPAPTLCETFYDNYRAAHAQWHATKSNAAALAVRDAYNKWATAFLGEANSERVKALAAKAWDAA